MPPPGPGGPGIRIAPPPPAPFPPGGPGPRGRPSNVADVIDVEPKKKGTKSGKKTFVGWMAGVPARKKYVLMLSNLLWKAS